MRHVAIRPAPRMLLFSLRAEWIVRSACYFWLAVAAFLLFASGCQRAAPPVYVSSAEVEALDAPLAQKVNQQLEKLCGTASHPKLLGDTSGKNLSRGLALYRERCEACHGISGDGNGPAAVYLNPRPRDYRRGIFKFTSTGPGAKALRADLKRTLLNGIKGTSMPSFQLLPEEDIEALLDHVYVLTYRGELETQLAILADSEGELDEELVREKVAEVLEPWKQAPQEILDPPTRMPPSTADSIEAGRKAFLTEKANCFKCHGEDGRGQTSANVEGFKDVWGQRTRAADLTSGMLRGGDRPEDLYRRIYAGVKGTPMPESRTQFPDDPQTIWQLVHYVRHVAGARRRETLQALVSKPAAGAAATTSRAAAPGGGAATEPPAQGGN